MNSNKWKIDKIENIADVQTGPFGSQLHNSDYIEVGTPIITVEHLGERLLSRDSTPFVCEKDRLRLDKYSLKIGDVVFSRVGSVDRCSLVSKAENGWLFSGRCLRVRPNTNILYPKFLYYYFCLEDIKEYIRSIAVGATMPSINTKILNDTKIKFPYLLEQKAIAETLSCLDDKIELNNRINKNLEEMAQAIFKSWLVDFEPFQDGEFEDSELGKIPKGWKIGTLGDIASITSGKRPLLKQEVSSEEMYIPVVGASCIMAYTKEALYDEKILITGRVGTHGIIQRFNTPCWASDNTLVIKSEIYEFVFQTLRSIDFKSMNRGSTQPLITQTDLKNIRIIIPANTILKDFEIVVSKIMDFWQKNNYQNTTFSTIRDSLLPKLMSGEIRVPIEEV